MKGIKLFPAYKFVSYGFCKSVDFMKSIRVITL